jgi:RHS repeat-associated protein
MPLSSSTSTTQSSATAAASTDRLQYRVGEQTGTPVMLVASDGTPRENNRVFPFGEHWDSFTGSNNEQKFTTYQRDSESGLDYAMARSYAFTSGRFMTPDPGHVGASVDDPQSWNAYAYVSNDPINRVDPSGLMECFLDGIMTECGLALRMVDNEAAAFCPGNVCSGWDWDANAFKFFVASASGASGYFKLQDVAYLYESQGNLFVQRGGGGGKTSPPPQKGNCPTYIRNFFSDMIPLANQLGKAWDTDANFILGLSAMESGWLNDHNRGLFNPYGITKADKNRNNRTFTSFQQATDFWSNNFGSFIKGAKTIADFVNSLQPHYNFVTTEKFPKPGDYFKDAVTRTYNSVLPRRAQCGQ